MSNVLNRDLLYGIDLDLALLHPITTAHRNPGALPDANTARNSPVPNTFPKTLRENHLSLRLGRHRWAGIVHVNQAPAVAVPGIDLRLPAIRLNGSAIFTL